jgi:Skp family chaperone for outer membrane proteins
MAQNAKAMQSVVGEANIIRKLPKPKEGPITDVVGDLEAENANLKEKVAKLQAEADSQKGIRTIQDIQGKKEEVPIPMNVRLEREIRKYVAKKGGFREGVSEADKQKCKELLKRISTDECNRTKGKPRWDLRILDVDHRIVEK